ncbi:hypothetical protein Pcaca03_16850 [Pectobacterium carotovorum subsp. carotovorum]|uniref:Uncharacterized protein n=1 Tax=Pectobacterium carotovorum subsp. carotovorum TaxID=555 RepID=A0AAI9KZ67_PECCC|nr:hypothetical protein SOASR016_15470 [Pectobacterium carotovorum subsp. carotovorum]GLV69241.1 hypothetical protein Pcaca03_16850 [Pectobacterium carotovorum subsp. carotovorum]
MCSIASSWERRSDWDCVNAIIGKASKSSMRAAFLEKSLENNPLIDTVSSLFQRYLL